MSSASISTVVKMMESLPDPIQSQLVDHLREYLEDLRDEQQWEAAFARSQPEIAAAARCAKQQIASGEAKPLDLDDL